LVEKESGGMIVGGALKKEKDWRGRELIFIIV
jgi:hypothetical protein